MVFNAVLNRIFRVLLPAVLTAVFIIMPFAAIAADGFTAYDPAERKFIYVAPERAVHTEEIKKYEKKKSLAGRRVFEFKEKEFAGIKDRIAPGVDIEKHKKAKTSSRRIKDSVMRVELNNKEDGQWYRLSADIPKGYTVKKILKDNGTEIINSTSVDRKTGEIKGEELWYIEGDKVYFYDDPVSGYSVVLSPPRPSFSIMVEEPAGGAGQMSAIIYPYNGEQDLIGGINNIDHLGRDGDNGIGNDIDANAGGKIALRYTYGLNTYQYGNPGTSITRDFTHVSTTYEQLHVTPWGETEAVINTVFQTTTGAPEIPFLINKKTIIRGNKKWFATIYYITNNDAAATAVNIRFFQGADWNFNGNINNDSCAYDNDNNEDTVFGYKPAGSPISYGGYSGFLPSENHHVGTYNNTWTGIQTNLNNAAAYLGDAGTALEWSLGALTAGQRKVIDIIWGYGNTLNGQAQEDMQNEINFGKTKLFDTGISGISSPADGLTYQNSDGYVMITATAVNYGLRDWANLPVHVEITGPSGFYINSTFTSKTFTVPDAEQQTVECPFDISALAHGEYTIKVYTDLGADTGYADSNSSNDSKTVKIYLGGISALPQARQTVNIGQAGDIDLTVSNTTGADDRFDISLISVTMPWPGYLIDGAAGTTIAADADGNGVWEYINPSFNNNSNSLPDIEINNNTGYHLIYRKFVPVTAEGGEIDKSLLKFIGIANAAFSCTVEETTIAAYKNTVTKTLWLHGNDLSTQSPAVNINSLTTLEDTAGTGAAGLSYTQISRHASHFWSMSPVLHRDLKIESDIQVRLALSDARIFNTAKVTLMYTNGITSHIIGDYTYPLNFRIRDNIPEIRIFTIPVPSPVTIPAGYRLVLMFTNLGTGNTYFRVYHNSDAAQNSNISMSVTDYVGVDWIKSYDVFGVTSTAYVAGESLRISAQVSDPFGAYAVANARIAVYNPSGVTQVAGTTAMTYANTDSSSLPGYKQYYYDYTIPALPEAGMWTAAVEGEEDNGVRSTRVYNFYVRAPDHIQLNPVFSVIPAGNEAALKSQVVDIDGNSLNSTQLITVTVNGSAIFSAAPAGWIGEGTNTIYGNMDAAGYAEFSVYNASAENVTITPACALAGSPVNNINAYIWFTSPHHASVSVTDGIAAAGGTGEPVRVWIEDIYGNTVASSQFITVTLDNGGYFSSVPAGWSGAGTGTAFGFTNTSGYEDLTVQKDSQGLINVTPDSSSWGFPSFDEPAQAEFVQPGEYHIEVTDAGTGTLSAGEERVLNIQVLDADGLVVPIVQEVVIYTSGAATFTASTLSGVSGLGTNMVTGNTAATGLASITVINYTAQPVTVTPDSTLSGSISVPDRDVPVLLTWIPGSADHFTASAVSEYTEIGTQVVINLQAVDLYGNSVLGAIPVSVSVTGAAIFTSSSLDPVSGINTGSVFGVTDSFGYAWINVYNETAQTNVINPDSSLPGSTAVPDRDTGTMVIFTSNMPTPTVTVTRSITPTITPTEQPMTQTATETITQTSTETVTKTATQTVTETVTQTVTETITQTATQTITETTTQTATASVTGTITQTSTETVTETATQTVTETNTQTVTETMTETTTQTVTETMTQTATQTITETTTQTATASVTDTITQTATETITETATQTVTETITETNTQTVTETMTETSTETVTETITETVTQTVTETVTETNTRTVTETITETNTQTVTDTMTETATQTATETITETATETVTVTITETITQTVTETITETNTRTVTETITETSTQTATETVTETATQTATETITETTSQTATETITETYTQTATETVTGTATQTVTETITETATQTVTETITETNTQTVTETMTETATETITETITETNTQTVTETMTETATQTVTESITETNTQTVTETITETVTQTNTQTVTETITQTVTKTITETATETVTETITETVTETVTETITETATETVTETITETTTQTVTETITETATETVTETITETATETVTETITETVTQTVTETITETATETVTETITETATETVTETITETVTQTVTETTTETATETGTETITETTTQTVTQTVTETITQTTTKTITETTTQTVTASVTETITQTSTETVTETDTQTVTKTITETTTETVTETITETTTETVTETITETATETVTDTITWTATETVTQTGTQTGTETMTETTTQTVTETITGTMTETITETGTETVTETATETITLTATETHTPTISQTSTITMTETLIVYSPTITETTTETSTPTVSETITETFTETATETITETVTETATDTVTGTVTETITETATVTATETITETDTETVTETVTETSTASVTETTTRTATETTTETTTQTSTETVTETATQTVTETTTQTATETVTETTTQTITETMTETNTQTATETVTETSTESVTETATKTITDTMTETTTQTATETVTETSTESVTETVTQTITETVTETTTQTATESVTETATQTATETMTDTTTQTATASVTETATQTATETMTETTTQTATETVTETSTASVTETATETITDTMTETNTQTTTETATETATETVTETATETVTETSTASVTETATQTVTETMTETNTQTTTETATETSTASVTETATQTATGTMTETTTQTATDTVTETSTASVTETATETITDTMTETTTQTATETVTETSTASVTETATQTMTETMTETNTQTATETVTETSTESVTETITQTATETVTETSTESVTETVTETITNTMTETVTETSTESVTETATQTVTETTTQTATETTTQTATETTTQTATETVTETATESMTETATQTATETITETGTETATDTMTETATQTTTETTAETMTETATETITQTPTPTVTETMTKTVTGTATQTVSYTVTETFTDVPTLTTTKTATGTITGTVTQTVTETATPSATSTNTQTSTDTPADTFTVTGTITPTVTRTATQTVSNTPEISYTATQSITPTVTPVIILAYKVKITVYDSSGRLVSELAEQGNDEAVHQSYLSQDPFINRGVSLLEFREGKGRLIGIWDGKDKDGVSAPTGNYTAKIVSVDNNGNEYTLIKLFSVILENAPGIQNMQIVYDKNSIRFTGAVADAEWIKVKIYNIRGEIIRHYTLNSLDFEWDMKTVSGTRVSSGIYIAVITYKDANTGRIIKNINKVYVYR